MKVMLGLRFSSKQSWPGLLLAAAGRSGGPIIHPYQRCGYSDSPFARMHYFYTAGSRNGLEGVANRMTRSQNQEKGIQNVQTGVLPKSQKFQNAFVDGPVPFLGAANPFVQYLAPLGAKYIKKGRKNMKNDGFSPFGAG